MKIKHSYFIYFALFCLCVLSFKTYTLTHNLSNDNPKTGDILIFIIPLLVFAIVTLCFTIIYTKKLKDKENNKNK